MSRTEPAELRLKLKFVKSSSNARQGVPSSPHRASKCSQMQPWAAKLVYFSDVLDDFRPLSLKIAGGMHFSLKTTIPDCLNRPAELLRLCIRSHCSPGLDGWVASAPLLEIIVRWAAAAMLSKSLSGWLQCFKLCFARLHWRRNAPMRI